MKIRTLLFLSILPVFLVGCVTTPSKDPEHKKLVGITFQLQEDWDLWPLNTPGKYDKRATHSINPNRDTYPSEERSILKKGTEIRIVEINNYKNISIGDVWIGVVLKLIDPKTDETATVLYLWDEKNDDQPPPWVKANK